MVVYERSLISLKDKKTLGFTEGFLIKIIINSKKQKLNI